MSVGDALEQGLDSGVIDAIYLVNTMEVLEIIRFTHVNALVKIYHFADSHFNTHLR